nr:MAG TPA: RecT protein [Bacteriophage sp.]
MATVKGTVLAKRNAGQPLEKAHENVATLFNALISKEGFQKRFDELLGARAPQFISSMVTMINDDPYMMEVFRDNPISIIKAGLRAAAYDLPIDPALGQAYIVPFRNKGKMEATFIIGYKGLYQLAVRTGVYKKINVVDVRQGELISYDRLTEEAELKWYINDEERQKVPIAGYLAYFELKNGMRKVIWRTTEEINYHERKFRKGASPSKGWRDNWEAMASKTVLRELLGKWGLLSINYQTADPATLKIASDLATGQIDDEQHVIDLQAEQVPDNVDPATGEVRDRSAQEKADDAVLDASLDL